MAVTVRIQSVCFLNGCVRFPVSREVAYAAAAVAHLFTDGKKIVHIGRFCGVSESNQVSGKAQSHCSNHYGSWPGNC